MSLTPGLIRGQFAKLPRNDARWIEILPSNACYPYWRVCRPGLDRQSESSDIGRAAKLERERENRNAQNQKPNGPSLSVRKSTTVRVMTQPARRIDTMGYRKPNPTVLLTRAMVIRNAGDFAKSGPGERFRYRAITPNRDTPLITSRAI